MKMLFSLALGVLLAGCTVLPQREALDLYTLPVSSLPAAEGDGRIEGGLRLARPETSDALSSNRILTTRNGISFQAYPGARWAAAVPVLWRDWLLDAFWRDGRFTGLSASSDGLRADHELGGMLRVLHVEHRDGRSEAIIRFDARLIDTVDRSIIAAHRFEGRQPAAGTEAIDGVRALGTAADQLAVELINWAAEQAR
ncbi:MAG: ABC-type transport auxiliary lipoprotein family protein [Pseudohongiellaceae bacterium]